MLWSHLYKWYCNVCTLLELKPLFAYSDLYIDQHSSVGITTQDILLHSDSKIKISIVFRIIGNKLKYLSNIYNLICPRCSSSILISRACATPSSACQYCTPVFWGRSKGHCYGYAHKCTHFDDEAKYVLDLLTSHRISSPRKMHI